MSYDGYATRHTHVERGTNDDAALNSADGVWIHRIALTNTTGVEACVDFTDNDSTTVRSIGAKDGSSITVDVLAPFDNGFVIPQVDTGIKLDITWRMTG